jgi:hypothetical protein
MLKSQTTEALDWLSDWYSEGFMAIIPRDLWPLFRGIYGHYSLTADDDDNFRPQSLIGEQR